MDVLKQNHESRGLTYPRPRVSCPRCSNQLVLKWGPEKRLHFAHLSGDNINRECDGIARGSNGESFEHSTAKWILCDYLNSGAKVSLISGKKFLLF